MRIHSQPFGAALFAGLMGSSWSALALADLARFNAWVSLGAGVLIAAAVYFVACWLGPDEAESTQPRRLARGLAAAIAAGTLFLSLPPSEMLLGGWDPGVYLHTAAAVSHGKSLRIVDSDLASLDERERQVVARDLFGVVEPFGGMRVLPDGRTSPEFHHLYPSLLAIVYTFGGIRAALHVNAALVAVAVFLVFLLARRLVGTGCALGAALLFALNAAQIWQAGFSTAEPLTQVLLLGAFLYLGPTLQGRSVLDAVLCGSAFGLALLARYDTVLLLVPMALVLIVTWRRSHSMMHAQVAVGVFVLALLHLYLHQRYVAPYYTPLREVVGKALMGSGVLVVLWALLAMPPLRLPVRLARHDRQIRTFAVAAFLVWVGFVWFVRPQLDQPGPMTRLFASVLPQAVMGELAGEDAHNLLMLTSLLGKTTLALAFLGIAVMMFRERDAWNQAWLYGSVAVLLLLVTRVFNDHFMMWVARRYVPVVMPLLVVATVYGLRAVCAKVAERNGFAALGVTVVLSGMVLAGTIPPLLVVAGTKDWPGLTDWFEQMHPAVPERALVYTDQPGFAAPLRYLYRKHAFELQLRGDDRRDHLAAVMSVKLDQGQDVYLLSMQGPLVHPAFTCIPVGAFPLSTHVLNTRRYEVPDGLKPRGGDFVLYRLEEGGG